MLPMNASCKAGIPDEVVPCRLVLHQYRRRTCSTLTRPNTNAPVGPKGRSYQRSRLIFFFRNPVEDTTG